MAYASALTLNLIAKELCHIISKIPWQRRGNEPFKSNWLVKVTREDLMSSLDEFTQRKLLPAVSAMLDTRNPWDEQLHISKMELLALESYNGYEIRLHNWHDHIEITLLASRRQPARDMPTYFWLGELSEAS